jgi:hypothetical protein
VAGLSAFLGGHRRYDGLSLRQECGPVEEIGLDNSVKLRNGELLALEQSSNVTDARKIAAAAYAIVVGKTGAFVVASRGAQGCASQA